MALPEEADRRCIVAKEALPWFGDGQSGKIDLLDPFNLPTPFFRFQFRSARSYSVSAEIGMQLSSPAILGALYGLSEVSLAAVKRSKGSSKVRDRGSAFILWGAIVSSMSVAIHTPSAFSRFNFSSHFYPFGFGVFCVGVVLRWYSIIYLGRFFTVDIAIHNDHRVVDSGPYRFVRHPSYLGALLAFLGLGICMLNSISIMVLLIPIASAFLYRIRVEEAALVAALGNPYLEYSARTKRIIPLIF